MAAAASAAFVWWFTTGIVLYLCGLPRRTWAFTLVCTTVLLIGALAGLWVTRDVASEPAVYLAFLCAVVVFGWHELSYYLDLLTGPRSAPCPSGATGMVRFRLGVAVSLHHELAIIATGVLLIWFTRDAVNPFGAWTFLVLWAMRWSAKLNLFLGVPNLNEEFLPPHLQYLASYMRRRKANWLFPVSVLGGAAGVVWLLTQAVGLPDFARTGHWLVATLLALAVLEHLFLVSPFNEAMLWSWGFRSRKAGVRARALGTGQP
jgi:putative photosynthetic complex assembly protein 2